MNKIINPKIIFKKGLIVFFILTFLYALFFVLLVPPPETKTEYQFDSFYPSDSKELLLDWPKNSAPALNQEREKFIDNLLNELTLEEKIAQMILLPNDTPSENVERYPFSGIVFDQGKRKDGGNKLRNWRKTLNTWWELQKEVAQNNQRPFIPPFLKLNLQAGNGMSLSQTIFASRLNQGQANNPALTKEIANQQARQAASIGFNWVSGGFDSPIADKRNGTKALSFSEDPKINQSLAFSFVQGAQFLQDDQLQMMTSSRGFLALGSASMSHGKIYESESILLNRYLKGHLGAIQAGVLSIELSNTIINSQPMSTSEYLIQTVLKEKIGFNGIVSSPLNATAQISGCRLAKCIEAINAGVDVFYFDSDVAIQAGASSYGKKTYDASEKFIASTLQAVKSNKISINRINDAAKRVLRVKHQLGLFDFQSPIDRAKNIEFSDEKNDYLAKQLVKQSAVILKNSKQTLPLDKKSKILLTGLGADELSYQIGIWASNSLRNLNNRAIKKGISLKQSFAENEIGVEFDFVPFEYIDSQGITDRSLKQLNKRLDGKNVPKKDKKGINGEVKELTSDSNESLMEYQLEYEKQINKKLRYYQQIVMVISQHPVLNYQTSHATLNFSQYYQQQLKAFEQLQQLDSSITVIIYGHSPLYMPEIFDKANAVIFAGLPGSNASGIFDVLFNYQVNSTGTLAFSWPRQPCDFKHVLGIKDYDPFLKVGHGYDINTKNGSLKSAVPEEVEYCSPVKR